MWNYAFSPTLSSKTEWTPRILFSSRQSKCLPGGVLLACNQIRQLLWKCHFALTVGWLAKPHLYVQASQKPMCECQCFPRWWCVLSKDTRIAVCWAFCCFPFIFASIWSPGQGEARLQNSLCSSNRSQIQFSSEASWFWFRHKTFHQVMNYFYKSRTMSCLSGFSVGQLCNFFF